MLKDFFGLAKLPVDEGILNVEWIISSVVGELLSDQVLITYQLSITLKKPLRKLGFFVLIQF